MPRFGAVFCARVDALCVGRGGGEWMRGAMWHDGYDLGFLWMMMMEVRFKCVSDMRRGASSLYILYDRKFIDFWNVCVAVVGMRFY